MQLTRVNETTKDNQYGRGVCIVSAHIWRDLHQTSGAVRLSRATTKTDDWLTSSAPRAAVDIGDLVGSWQDERGVEEIVRDIYENRTL